MPAMMMVMTIPCYTSSASFFLCLGLHRLCKTVEFYHYLRCSIKLSQYPLFLHGQKRVNETINRGHIEKILYTGRKRIALKIQMKSLLSLK